MSASSTIAITRNPVVNNNPSMALDSKPTARKRTVSVAEKKFEMVFEGGTSEGADEKVFSGKDLSHSIRSEMVLERSKDLMQAKKKMINSTILHRPGRKVISKPEKPRWLIVIRVFTKNFLLLLVLIGLVQGIWRFASNSEDNVAGSMGISDSVGRIAEVEAFIKKTTKMMQVQVEAVDGKIESEIGVLRKEFTKKVEEQGTRFDNKLKTLEVRTDKLDNSLGDFSANNFVMKEDFEKFASNLKKSRRHGLEDRDWSLEDIRAYARETIEKEIEKHAADGLGRVDYAMASGGATVVHHSEPFIVGKGNSWFSFIRSRNGVDTGAKKMLQPSFGEPGQCFALKGNTGFVEIKLRKEIIPEAITLEHVTKSVAYDRSSALKDCRIFGWLQGKNADPSSQAEMFLLSEFSYDLEKSNAQTFNVESNGYGVVNMVRLDFTSNHGSPHTCIYRLRVHGHEPNSVLAI